MSTFKLKGLVAAPFTPFHDNGDLNLSLVDKYIECLLSDGVKSVFICGTTGEGASMTVDERKLVAEKWVKSGQNKLDAIVVHVGSGNLRETIELAKHAQHIKASAIATVPPVYFKPKTVDELVDYLREVSLAAPNIPLYYYHIPGITGVNFAMDELLEASQGKVPTLHGVKYSDPDLISFGIALNRFGDKYQLCYSKDELLLASLTFGCEAFVGSTYNYVGRPCNKVIASYEKRDMEAAQKELFKFLEMVKLLFKYKLNVATQKAVMAVTRIDLGPTRSPVPNLSAELKEELKKDLQAMGYFEWTNQ